VLAILLLIPFSWVFAFSPPDPRKRLAGWVHRYRGMSANDNTCNRSGALYSAPEKQIAFPGGRGLLLAFLLLSSYRGRERMGWDGMGWSAFPRSLPYGLIRGGEL
jgi:hypothetical protein